jgi:hypothetical protein
VINHIQVLCGIEPIRSLIITYEDNAACIAQMQSGYVKSNVANTLHLNFSTHMNLKLMGEISILQTKLCDNLADLFTKSLPYYTFSKCVAGIVMRRLRDLQDLGEALS